jgi:hypothetical protein
VEKGVLDALYEKQNMSDVKRPRRVVQTYREPGQEVDDIPRGRKRTEQNDEHAGRVFDDLPRGRKSVKTAGHERERQGREIGNGLRGFDSGPKNDWQYNARNVSGSRQRWQNYGHAPPGSRQGFPEQVKRGVKIVGGNDTGSGQRWQNHGYGHFPYPHGTDPALANRGRKVNTTHVGGILNHEAAVEPTGLDGRALRGRPGSSSSSSRQVQERERHRAAAERTHVGPLIQWAYERKVVQAYDGCRGPFEGRAAHMAW